MKSALGAFEAMTCLSEFTQLRRAWRDSAEQRMLDDLRKSILNSESDPAAARRIAFASGFLEALRSFDIFVEQTIRHEQRKPKETPDGMHPLRRF